MSKEQKKEFGIQKQTDVNGGNNMREAQFCPRGLQKNPVSGKCDLPKVEHWKLNKQSAYKNNFEFNHEKTGTVLNVFKPADGRYWGVSILRKKSLYEYLAGGNSRIHDADRIEAMELAKAYMLLHPMGRKDY